jgi:voltage-dependent calcium channel alpha-2/delta-3
MIFKTKFVSSIESFQDAQMTDYEWECRERAKQRERFMVYRKSRNFMNLPEDPSNLGYDFIEDDENDRMKKFNFMTTVSIPVYDKRENAVSKIAFT